MRFPVAVLLVLTATLFAQTGAFKSYQEEETAWFKTHAALPANASPEQRLAFDQEVAKASAQWVQHWPDDPRAWAARLRWLARLKSTPDQQLEETGDTLLRVAKEHPYKGFHFVPFEATVAEIWSERKIRPEQCLQLTQEAVREDKRAESDNPSAAREAMPVVARGLFDALELERHLALQLKKFDIAESAVDQMRQYLRQSSSGASGGSCSPGRPVPGKRRLSSGGRRPQGGCSSLSLTSVSRMPRRFFCADLRSSTLEGVRRNRRRLQRLDVHHREDRPDAARYESRPLAMDRDK